jgi:hypothetical protein
MDAAPALHGNLTVRFPTHERWRCDCGCVIDVEQRLRGGFVVIFTESTDPDSRWRCDCGAWQHLHGGEWRPTKRGY